MAHSSIGRTPGLQSGKMGSTPICATMHPKYQDVIKLRRKGESYREISRGVGISKNSVSRWCKDLKLPLAVQKIIEAKTKASHTQLSAYNKHKHQIVQAENKKIIENAVNQISSLSKHELLLIGVALYWAEGYKKQDKLPTPSIDFANSDPDMIFLFLRFLREILQVPEDKLYVSIRIHPNVDEKSAINFWSQVTNIPKERFHIITQISRASQGKRPKYSLPYGTLDLRVHSRQKFFQIKGWIDGLIRQICQRII